MTSKLPKDAEEPRIAALTRKEWERSVNASGVAIIDEDDFDELLDVAFSKDAEDERAAVVRDLRRFAAETDSVDIARAYREAANWFERGDHLKRRESNG